MKKEITRFSALKQLDSNNIISIHGTQNQTELAEIYTVANLFVNPISEEVLEMINIEANACGISVFNFDTGRSPECINSKSDMVVKCDDVDAMESEIKRICETKQYLIDYCISEAMKFNRIKGSKSALNYVGAKWSKVR